LNRDAATGAYHPHRAQRRAAGRRVRSRRRKLGCNRELRTVVADHLEGRWSPEQICRLLPSLFRDRPEIRVTPETIYQALYTRGPDRLQRDGVRLLRSGRVHRKRRRRSGERTGRFVAPMVMIDRRPADVADRRIAGHWEGDLITGSANRSAIGTVVERTTRYLLLLHLPDGHGAEQVRDALVDAVAVLPSRLRRSLTWDQGVEPPRRVHPSLGRRGLLLRACQSVAARHEREHERAAAPVLPQGHGLARAHRRPPGQCRRRTQRSDPVCSSAGRPAPSSSIDSLA
jgi:IS30 family transposase